MNKNKKISLSFLFLPIVIILMVITLSLLNCSTLGIPLLILLTTLTPLTFGLSIFFFLKDKSTRSDIKIFVVTQYKNIKKNLKKGYEVKNIKEFFKKTGYLFLISFGILVSLSIILLDIVLIKDEILKPKGSTKQTVVKEDTYPKEESKGLLEEFKEEWKDDLAELTKNFGIDDYVWEWDGRLEGYYRQNPYIAIPRYYLYGEKNSIIDTWVLHDGYKLELSCPKKDLSTVIAGEYYSCTVKYNGKIVQDDVRYYISYELEGKSVPTEISMLVYSYDQFESSNRYEYLILGSYHTGSRDDISVYELKDGNANRVPFSFEGELKDTWTVANQMYLDLYYNKESLKLVTNYHDPYILVRSVFRVWNLGEDALTLERTFGNIVE